jgi:hypothetical protein
MYYREIVRFAEQVERYFATFDRSRVKVILFDDFVRDVATVYADVLRFLEVDDTFQPTFERVNESKRPISPTFQAFVVRPPRPIARLIPHLRRLPVAHQIRSAILAVNSRSVERPPMSLELRARLTRELAPEVERLGALIGADLSAWQEPPTTRPETANVA